MGRPATPEDLDAICASLPETELGISWGDRPTWKVPRGEKGKGFLLYRMPHSTAVDPETGEMYDDLVVITTPTAAEKQALVDDPDLPFFTIDHFRGRDAVVVQQSRLGEVDGRRAPRDHHRCLGPTRTEASGPPAQVPRPVTADPARLAAYDVVRAVRTEDAYANLVLQQAIRDHGLVGRDAAFATELAAGTLRGQGTYDAVIDACLTRGKVKPRIRDVLRIGVHQLLGMRVGDHAAVSTTVDLARARSGAPTVGLVNAVLRKVSAHDLDTWIKLVAPDQATDPIGHLAVAHSHPRSGRGGAGPLPG